MSQQMTNLLRRYGVESEDELLHAISVEYEQETGWMPSREAARAWLDQMLEAEYQRIAGGAYDSTEARS